MKKIFFLFLMIFWASFAQSQVNVWINNQTAVPGQLTVPVYVSGYDSIATVSLKLFYSSALTYSGIQNVSPELAFYITSNLPFPPAFAMESFSVNCEAIADSTVLFELVFNFTGGQASFLWDSTYCNINSCNGDTLITHFNDGYINTSVGINPVEPLQITRYPNPTSGSLTLSWDSSLDEEAELQALTADGRIAYRQQFLLNHQSQQFDLGNLTPGIYLLRVSTRENSYIVGRQMIVR